MTEKQLLVSRIKALVGALEGSDVAELELNENGTRIVLKRRTRSAGAEARSTGAALRHRPRTRQPHAAGTGGSPAGVLAPEPTVAVVAPLTGVFYVRPSPSSAPFCQPGEAIHSGQLVCIVEAMKVFNEIQSEVSGTVTAVVPKDGQLVQKGDALIRVKPF